MLKFNFRSLLNGLEDKSYNEIDKHMQEIEVIELATPPKPGN